MNYYLAIDIGASSGRHIVGWIDNEKLCTKEIYRFENNLQNTDSGLIWDIDNLVREVKNGIKMCKEVDMIPQSVAIDTWGVDYVLLDENKNKLLPVYCYRDSRTDFSSNEVEKILSSEWLYNRCGIQKQKFNTVYQLYSDKISGKLNNARYFMMIPSYLSYSLTGVVKNEYTEATTGGFVNAATYDYDKEVINTLGFNSDLFKGLSMPGEEVGCFSKEVEEYVGFNSKVVFCPSHDTASAVAACPLDDGDIYISSGTWSLIGTELEKPVLTNEARLANFTNEGGINRKFRFLKNYMGMWLFQNIRRNLSKSLSYDEMMNLAIKSDKYYYIDVNADEFVAPENMIDAIKTHIGKDDISLGEIINSVYHSLAKSYKDAIEEVEKISGNKANAVRIVGGGSKDSYLNKLTCEYTGKKVYAGPVEATAIGNLISQIIADNSGYTLDTMRKIICDSFEIKEVK